MTRPASSAADVADALRRAVEQCEYITGHGQEAFLRDDPHGRLLRDGGERLIIAIQSALDDLPASFAEEHADLPLTLVRGMRNRLAHGYDDINPLMVWTTLSGRLPAFVREVLRRLEA